MTLPALSVALVCIAVAVAGAGMTTATRRGPGGKRRPARALRSLGVALLLVSGFYLGATTTLGAWLGTVAPAAGIR